MVHLNKITLINDDCMNLLSTYGDNEFDLAIVDPPYGINAPNMSMGTNPNKSKTGDGIGTASRLKKGRLNSGSGKLKNRVLNTMRLDWDNEIPTKAYFDELFRISKNQVIFGGNYFGLPATRCIVCWDKLQPWDNFSQWEMAWTSFDKPAKMYRYSSRGGANEETKIHPTQKPIALYGWMLNQFAKEGDKIIDTHFGSGSLGIACHDLGFELTAIERDKQYFADSIKRITKYQLHLNLF